MISIIGTLASTMAFASTDAALIKEGKKIFETKALGNCSACHALNGVKINSVGSLGPKLSGLKNWPTQTLYNTVYNIYAERHMKVSAMPAFGRDGWLSDQQIHAVVAYLKTIN